MRTDAVVEATDSGLLADQESSSDTDLADTLGESIQPWAAAAKTADINTSMIERILDEYVGYAIGVA